MTNYEHYKDEIIKMKEDYEKHNAIPITFADKAIELKRRVEPSLFGSDDSRSTLNWLFQEYEPDKLKNGDNLNQGDGIMVRNSDKEKWIYRMYVFFANNRFYVFEPYNGGESGQLKPYMQARMLKKSEKR